MTKKERNDLHSLVNRWEDFDTWPDHVFDGLGLNLDYDMEREAAHKMARLCALELRATLDGPVD